MTNRRRCIMHPAGIPVQRAPEANHDTRRQPSNDHWAARTSALSSTGLTLRSQTGLQLSDHRYTAAGTANARDGLATANARRTHNNATSQVTPFPVPATASRSSAPDGVSGSWARE